MIHQSHWYALSRATAGAPSLTAVDLFSGVGGITLGLMNAGWKVLLASDIDDDCARTHEANLPAICFERADVRDLSPTKVKKLTGLRKGELDLLVGGPPCQGFSIMGERDLHDDRNDLFFHFIRMTDELRPKCVLIENVPGLATLGKGETLRRIGEEFREIGYEIRCAELLAAQYGVPQMRWRLAFIAWPIDTDLAGSGFPEPSHGNTGIGDLVSNRSLRPDETEGFLTAFDAIGDLPPVESGGIVHEYETGPSTAYQIAMRSDAPDRLENHYAPRLSAQNLKRISILKPGEDWRSLPHELLPAGMQRALRKDHTRRYRRMTWEGVPRAIITRFRDPKSGEYTHPEQDRTISIREAARIQSFPDWFRFEGTYSSQYNQVGNAVPPLMARALGFAIAEVLRDPEKRTRAPKSRYQIPSEFQPGLFSDALQEV